MGGSKSKCGTMARLSQGLLGKPTVFHSLAVVHSGTSRAHISSIHSPAATTALRQSISTPQMSTAYPLPELFSYSCQIYLLHKSLIIRDDCVERMRYESSMLIIPAASPILGTKNRRRNSLQPVLLEPRSIAVGRQHVKM